MAEKLCIILVKVQLSILFLRSSFCFFDTRLSDVSIGGSDSKEAGKTKKVAPFLLCAFDSNKRGKETKSTSSIYPDLCCSVIRRTQLLMLEEQHRNYTGMLISPQPDQEGNKLQRQKILSFIYPIYNHNWRNITILFIYNIYISNKTSIKQNILTIEQNTTGSRSGYGLISTPGEHGRGKMTPSNRNNRVYLSIILLYLVKIYHISSEMLWL